METKDPTHNVLSTIENAGRTGISQQIMMAIAAAVTGLLVYAIEHGTK